MKLYCPHCGVKGSAEDSFSGRKVKCPKCEKVFEVKPELAPDLSGKADSLATLSPAATELPAPAEVVEQPAPDEEDEAPGDEQAQLITETEQSLDPGDDHADLESMEDVRVEEDVLRFGDIASEINLQEAESEMEEPEEPGEVAPVELSSLQDEFGQIPADEILTVEDDEKEYEEALEYGEDPEDSGEFEEQEASAEEDTLTWGDIASEIDLQEVESAMEEPEEPGEVASVERSTLQDEFGQIPTNEILTVEDDEKEYEEALEYGEEPEDSGEFEGQEASAEEDTLTWGDIAPEIDLHEAESAMEEPEEPGEVAPVERSTLPGDFGQMPINEGLAVEEDREAEYEEELSTEEDLGVREEADNEDLWAEEIGDLAPNAADLEEEPAEITESLVEEESEPVEEDEEIELEPYGVDKEQCWQCGKEANAEQPFVAREGRLYCPDCFPVEEQESTPADVSSADGSPVEEQDSSVGATETVGSQFSIGDTLRRAWEKSKGAKGAIWAGTAIMYLVILVIVAGGALLLPAMDGDLTNVPGLISAVLYQAVINVFSVLFSAGLLYMGVRKVAGETISWKMIFQGFSCAGKLIVATLLQSILVTLGFLLLILPGLYLTVGYAMTLPLIVDRGVSPWQAMEMSRKAIHKVWWRMAGLLIIMTLLFLVSFLPLGIGVIWTWPMFVILAGVVYRHLFKSEEKAV